MDDEKALTAVAEPSLELPAGYVYGATRGADLVLQGAHKQRFDDLIAVLESMRFKVADMVAGGGQRSQLTASWDGALEARGWGKRNVTVKRVVDQEYVSSVRSHEIDMFGSRVSGESPYPGVACEMEWSNKDPFFDRDLGAFAQFHLEGIIDVGIIITRGPALQAAIKRTIPGGYSKSRGRYELKYGESTTHWNKLVPRVERGGGGGCPLLLIGIEPKRFDKRGKLLKAAKKADSVWGDVAAMNALHKEIAAGQIS